MPESVKDKRPLAKPEVEADSAQVSDQGLDYLSVLHQSIGNRAVGRLLTDGMSPVQRIASTPDAPTEEDTLRDVAAATGGGAALDEPTRIAMEGRLGHDFSGVRIHTDPSANALSQRLNARAFTT